MIAIKVLGPGCANCARLEQNTRQAVASLGLEATVTHVSDWAEFARYGLLFTPGLVVNEQLISAGRVPSPAEIGQFLNKAVA